MWPYPLSLFPGLWCYWKARFSVCNTAKLGACKPCKENWTLLQSMLWTKYKNGYRAKNDFCPCNFTFITKLLPIMYSSKQPKIQKPYHTTVQNVWWLNSESLKLPHVLVQFPHRTKVTSYLSSSEFEAIGKGCQHVLNIKTKPNTVKTVAKLIMKTQQKCPFPLKKVEIYYSSSTSAVRQTMRTSSEKAAKSTWDVSTVELLACIKQVSKWQTDTVCL